MKKINLTTIASTSALREQNILDILFIELRDELGNLLDEAAKVVAKTAPWHVRFKLRFFLGNTKEDSLHNLERMARELVRSKKEFLERMQSSASVLTSNKIEHEVVRDFMFVITSILQWIEESQEVFSGEENKIFLKMVIHQLTKLVNSIRKDIECGAPNTVFEICKKWYQSDAEGKTDTSTIIQNFISNVLN